MKYNHAVKYNGVIYPTGAEVPVEDANTKANEDAEKAGGDGEDGVPQNTEELNGSDEKVDSETPIEVKGKKK